MYSYKGDIKFTEESFVVDFSVMTVCPEHDFDIRAFGLERSEIHFSSFLRVNNGNNKNAEELVTCDQGFPVWLD